MKEFLKAFIYFMENGLPEKLAKELAEKVTGTKVTDEARLEAFLPEIKKAGKLDTKPKKLATKKERGELVFVNSKISNPMKSKMVLQGLDGTTESIYSQFRLEQEAIKKGMEKNLKYILDNNVALSSKDRDNLFYNAKIYNDLTKQVSKLSDDLVADGKNPQQIFDDYKDTFTKKQLGFKAEDIKKDPMFLESMNKIKKLIGEMEDIKSGKAETDRKALVKRKYQGKGYGPSEGIYRTLARQFLRDEIESGRIETTPSIYNAMKEGNHPFIDPIKVFRHHYGDDAFDTLEKYIDNNYPGFGSSGMRYPGRFEFRKLGLVVKNKKAPGKTYAHYSLPDEIDAEIESIDNVISDIELGKSPMVRNKQEMLEAIRAQNETRAKYVKIKNEITPSDSSIDLSGYTNKSLNELAEEGEKLQSELSLVDEDGSSTLPYNEFQEKSARLEEISKILEEAQKKPEDFFPDDSAEIIPFNLKKSDDDPTKFAKGGIVEVLI